MMASSSPGMASFRVVAPPARIAAGSVRALDRFRRNERPMRDHRTRQAWWVAAPLVGEVPLARSRGASSPLGWRVAVVMRVRARSGSRRRSSACTPAASMASTRRCREWRRGGSASSAISSALQAFSAAWLAWSQARACKPLFDPGLDPGRHGVGSGQGAPVRQRASRRWPGPIWSWCWRADRRRWRPRRRSALCGWSARPDRCSGAQGRLAGPRGNPGVGVRQRCGSTVVLLEAAKD